MKNFQELCELIEYLNSKDMQFWTHSWDGEVYLSFNMNDYFYWGTSDSEEVYYEDLPLLKQCEADLIATEEKYADCYLAELFACRKRGMAPQGACLKNLDKDHPKVKQLLIDCGPREIDFLNPQSPEGEYLYKREEDNA